MIKYKVIIVGAGPAGIGNAIALRHLGLGEKDFVVLERSEVGASFKKWPVEMKFITPSFTGNQFGLPDLNAIGPHTSPAFTLNKEHPSGEEYARYLEVLVSHFQVPVKNGIEVISVKKEGDHFEITTDSETYSSEFLIWCGGEFQFPNLEPFPGAQYCIHNTHIKSYKDVLGESQLVIGGYESGIDAAVNFAKLGKKVTVLDSGSPWKESSSDPSTVLSTYTFERLHITLDAGDIELVEDFRVSEVKKVPEGYEVISSEGKKLVSDSKPILAIGFSGSTELIKDLFEENENGDIALTENDESTATEGLFLSGPMVRQSNAIFCFIYKFRQRFPIIAKEIATRLKIDDEALNEYKKTNMYLDDLSCCDEECSC